MGDRAMAEIRIEDGSVYFYTHWHGKMLPTIAKNALKKAESRIGDYPYALRIVLDSLIKDTDSRDKETGSGIMLSPYCEDSYNDNEPSVLIDLVNNKVQTSRKI